MAQKINPLTGKFDLVLGPGTGTATTSFDTDSGSATPTVLGEITFQGGNLIETSGAGNTVTIDAATTIPVSIATDSGSCTPAANAMSIIGGGDVSTSASGSTVTVTAVIPDPPVKRYWFGSESLQPLETNFAPIEKLTGTNVISFVRAFDDTTEEFGNGKIQIPNDLDITGTVTFRAYVMAKTAAANKNVKLTFGHRAIDSGEDFDQAYTDVSIDDQAIDGTQDRVTEISWTDDVSNLGWSADDLVFFRLSRESATTNNLSGDMYLFSFCIDIPRLN